MTNSFIPLSQPWLELLTILVISISSKIRNANRCMPPCARLTPHTADLSAHIEVSKPPTYVFGTIPLVGRQ